MRRRTSVVSLLSATLVLVAWPANALARAIVRFVHAVPGAGHAELTITGKGGTTPVGAAGFGDATHYRQVPTGPITWRLTGAASKVLASGRAVLRGGTYTVVALAKGSGATLGFYRDQAGVSGKARLRLVHGAPELGTPNLRLNDRIVARGVRFSQATPYLTVRPGTVSVAATPPGSTSRVVFRDGIRLVAGQAATGIVIGTDGQRTRILTLSDSRRAAGARHRSAGAKHAASRRPFKPAASPSRSRASVLTIHRGDSLWSVARARVGRDASNARLEAEVRRLWKVNARHIGTGDSNLLFPGQQLRVG